MTNTEVMRESVTDMLGVEQHILRSLERQMGDERVRSFQSAYELLRKIESVLNSHIILLQRHLAVLDGGGVESRLKKAASSIMDTVSGIYGKLRSDEPVARELRGDYTALQLACISYSMLHTSALAVRDTETAAMADRHLTELTPLAVQLGNIIPFVFAKELVDEGKTQDATVAQEAVSSLRKAWSHEATHT